MVPSTATSASAATPLVMESLAKLHQGLRRSVAWSEVLVAHGVLDGPVVPFDLDGPKASGKIADDHSNARGLACPSLEVSPDAARRQDGQAEAISRVLTEPVLARSTRMGSLCREVHGFALYPAMKVSDAPEVWAVMGVDRTRTPVAVVLGRGSTKEEAETDALVWLGADTAIIRCLLTLEPDEPACVLYPESRADERATAKRTTARRVHADPAARASKCDPSTVAAVLARRALVEEGARSCSALACKPAPPQKVGSLLARA